MDSSVLPTPASYADIYKSSYLPECAANLFIKKTLSLIENHINPGIIVFLTQSWMSRSSCQGSALKDLFTDDHICVQMKLKWQSIGDQFIADDKEERNRENKFRTDIFLNECFFELLLETASSTARGWFFPGSVAKLSWILQLFSSTKTTGPKYIDLQWWTSL